jgi:hypothetical protein
MDGTVDPHIVTAILCILGAVCIAGSLVIWLAVELEMKSKK